MVNERDDWPGQRPKDPTEGVRIIGAEEAAEALEKGEAASRLPDEHPKFGDRPEDPPEDVRPALRFPLGSSGDPTTIDRPPIAPRPPEPTTLPHWTEPATGQVPAVLANDERDDVEAWSSFASSPRWRDDSSGHDDYDDVPSILRDEEASLGALDESERPREDDFFSFEDDPRVASRSVFGPPTGDAYDREALAASAPPGAAERDRLAPGPRARRQPRPGPGGGHRSSRGGERDLGTAVIVGVAIAALAVLLFNVGPVATMFLVTPFVAVAALELLTTAREAGYQPPALVGLVATIGLVIGAYNYGEAAIPAVLFLTTVVLLLWYLLDAGGESPVMNSGVTLLSVVWVGMFGAYAALLLSLPDRIGITILAGAVIGTAAYDVGGYFVGRNAGSRPLSEASPNKTVEGLLGGMLLAVVASVVWATQAAPFDGLGDGLALGLVVAVAAPLGDLCQSLVKRDLGVKDMGTLLPGHGGLLDRFDALLFVLPAVWYLGRLADFWVG